jgi:hypothetical protein
MAEKPKITDAEFEVVTEAPNNLPAQHRSEPMLTRGWPLKLGAMLVVLLIGTLLLARANGGWPFNG